MSVLKAKERAAQNIPALHSLGWKKGEGEGVARFAG